MTEAKSHAAEFFVAGGTLGEDDPSYVKRAADYELLELIRAGKFCYVLTPRQMGKSSLMIRTAQRLEEPGVRTAVVDLTGIGANVPIDQWYFGLVTQIASELRLSVDVEDWWNTKASLGYVQRFRSFLRDVVLAEIPGRVVVFIDEMTSLPQSARYITCEQGILRLNA